MATRTCAFMCKVHLRAHFIWESFCSTRVSLFGSSVLVTQTVLEIISWTSWPICTQLLHPVNSPCQRYLTNIYLELVMLFSKLFRKNVLKHTKSYHTRPCDSTGFYSYDCWRFIQSFLCEEKQAPFKPVCGSRRPPWLYHFSFCPTLVRGIII